MIPASGENRLKQVAVGAGILGLLTALFCGALIGRHYMPGLLGEWIGMMVGVMTTPFFLEGSFLIIGLTVVVTINHWRQKREGDDLVYLEQVEETDVTGGMPESARWAVYREKPLDGEEPPLLVQAEGALAIGDWESAAEAISAMTAEELKRPETLALRLGLARATGRGDLAGELEMELREAKDGRN